jgi:membrane-bound lytic murein transglycosylase MltF
MKSIHGYVLTLVMLLNTVIGCTSSTYRAEDGKKTYVKNEYYVSVTENSTEMKNTYSEEIIDIDNVVSRSSQLDYGMRRDLGFPRIESIINSYEQIIKRYAHRYGFDWRLILAVMNQESRFRVRAVSHRGAYGLMQIMPVTGRDVSSALGIESISQPEDNIAGGVYYLWWLYTMFDPGDDAPDTEAAEEDRIRLALAAYNGGPTRVRNAQRIARYLDLDPYRWDVIRDILPMLSSQYSTLHRYVWTSGRPVGGYFSGSDETINYVESVMGYFSYYEQLFD